MAVRSQNDPNDLAFYNNLEVMKDKRLTNLSPGNQQRGESDWSFYFRILFFSRWSSETGQADENTEKAER